MGVRKSVVAAIIVPLVIARSAMADVTVTLKHNMGGLLVGTPVADPVTRIDISGSMIRIVGGSDPDRARTELLVDIQRRTLTALNLVDHTYSSPPGFDKLLAGQGRYTVSTATGEAEAFGHPCRHYVLMLDVHDGTMHRIDVLAATDITGPEAVAYSILRFGPAGTKIVGFPIAETPSAQSVTSISTDPISKSIFAIPAGYKLTK